MMASRQRGFQCSELSCDSYAISLQAACVTLLGKLGGNRVRRGPYTAYYDIGSGLVEDR